MGPQECCPEVFLRVLLLNKLNFKCMVFTALQNIFMTPLPVPFNSHEITEYVYSKVGTWHPSFLISHRLDFWDSSQTEGESIPAGRKHGCRISRNVKPYSYQCLSPMVGKTQTVKQAMTLPIVNELRGSI